MLESLSIHDIVVVFAYFAAVLGVGLWFGRQEETTEDFMLGGRRTPWLAVLGSLIATEISAATFLATPGVGFASDLRYLQFGIGSLLGRVFIALVFLKIFYDLRCVSIYEYLAHRFGGTSHRTAAVFFLLSRLTASGVRLMIASAGLHVILGVPFGLAMILFTVLCLAYTGLGGIKAVIATDCVQAVVFIGAGLSMFFVLHHLVGWGEIIHLGNAAGRLDVFNFWPDQGNAATGWFLDSNVLILAVVFGFVNTVAMQGTDHDFTQRMLTCRDVKQAQRSVILSGVAAIPVAAIFLLIGVGLYAYYQVSPDPTLPTQTIDGVTKVMPDKVFPHFIVTVLPDGLRGLLLCGVLAAAMSSLDSAMAALSSSVVVDLYKPLVKGRLSERGMVWLSRAMMVAVAIVLGLIAWQLERLQQASGGQFLWLAFQVSTVTYSGLLGVFLLGMLTKRGRDGWNLVAMFSGSLTTAGLLALLKLDIIHIAWQWPMLIGVTATVVIGALVTKIPVDDRPQ
ncbi:MAG: sodium:solute symporter family transporter [Puniceicoccales bacterium]